MRALRGVLADIAAVVVVLVLGVCFELQQALWPRGERDEW